MTLTVRPAKVDDLPGVAKVAIETDQEGEGAGADFAYTAHLLTRGQLWVALDSAAVIIGYAASIRIGDVDMLADLFISPSQHGRGIGRALLDNVWSDAPERMTLSSTHPSAVPLYVRFGMTPQFPVFYLRGQARQAAPAVTIAEVSPVVAADTELKISGADRTSDYRYWSARPHSKTFVARVDEELVGAGAIGGSGVAYGVSHLVVKDASHAANVARCATVGLPNPPLIVVPGPNRALAPLLDEGWRIVDVDQYMASKPDLIDPELLFPHSGLM